MDHNDNRNNGTNNNNNGKDDDPYIALEDVDGAGAGGGSSSALNFAMAASEACLTALGNPKTSGTGSYQRILNVLEGSDAGDNNGNSQDQGNSTNGRIPYVSKMGTDMKGNDVLYNLWKDSKVRYDR